MPARAHGPKRRGAPTRGLALIGLFALTACGSEPAYQLSWKLTDDPSMLDSADELTQVSQCSTVGVASVRVTTMAKDAIYDVREYPCFHDGPVDGPSLEEVPPGDYELEFVGLRRTGEPWACPSLTPKPNGGGPDPDPDEDGSSDAPCVARGHAALTVREGDLPLAEVALLAPPQCDDGIDNDGDGKVDGKDPACLLDASLAEADDAGVVIFELATSFLDSPVVEPPDVNVGALRLEIDGQPFTEVTTTGLGNQLDLDAWPFELPLLAYRFDEDEGTTEHQLGIVGVQGDSERTALLTHDFSVNEQQIGFVSWEAHFLGADFLDPIVEPIGFAWGVPPHPSLEQNLQQCAVTSMLVLDRLAVRVIDEDGQVVDPAVVDLRKLNHSVDLPSNLGNVTQANGWTEFDCVPTGLESLPLLWGNYSLEFEARSGGAVCFSTEDPLPLPPYSASPENVVIPRVFADVDTPPAGCEECMTADDCPDITSNICSGGLCVRDPDQP